MCPLDGTPSEFCAVLTMLYPNYRWIVMDASHTAQDCISCCPVLRFIVHCIPPLSIPLLPIFTAFLSYSLIFLSFTSHAKMAALVFLIFSIYRQVLSRCGRVTSHQGRRLTVTLGALPHRHKSSSLCREASLVIPDAKTLREMRRIRLSPACKVSCQFPFFGCCAVDMSCDTYCNVVSLPPPLLQYSRMGY